MFKIAAIACFFLFLASATFAQTPVTPDNVSRLERVARYGADEKLINSYLAPDGSTIAKGGSLGVWLFDSDRLTNPRLLIPTDRPIRHLSYNSDGSLLAYSLGQDVHLINPITGAEIITFPNNGAFFAFHPTQPWIVTIGYGHVEASVDAPAHDAVVITLRDVSTGEVIKETYLEWANSLEGEINDIAFSDDGKWIAASYLGAPYDSCGQRSAAVYVWDAETFISGDFRRARQGIEFTSDGKLISLEADYQYFIFDHVAIYDLQTRVEQLIPFDQFHELGISAEPLSILPPDEPVVTDPPVLTAPDGDLPAEYSRLFEPLPPLRFGPFILAADGSRLGISLLWDGHIQAWFAAVWNFSEARITFSRFHPFGENELLRLTHWFSPDLRYLAAEYDGAIDYFFIEIYDLEDGDRTDTSGDSFYFNSGVFGNVEGYSPDGSKLILSESRVTGCGGLIRRWIVDIPTGLYIAPLSGSASAFSPNGQLVANYDADGTDVSYFDAAGKYVPDFINLGLTVYDTATGEPVYQDAAVYSGTPRWTADGSALVVDHHDGTFTVFAVQE